MLVTRDEWMTGKGPSSYRGAIPVAGPDAQDAVQRAHPDLPVTDRVGPGVLGEGLDQGVRAVIRDHEVQPDLRQQRPLAGAGQAEVDVGTVGRLTELPAEPTDLAHGQSVYPAIDQGLDQLIQLLGPDNGRNQLHAIPPPLQLLVSCSGSSASAR